MSFIAFDDVSSFLRLKDVTNTCKHVRRSLSIGRSFFNAIAESWKKLKTSNVFSSFIVYSNRNRSAPVRELLSNNSLFVGRVLIFFATDLKAVNYCLTIQCLS